MTHYKKVADGRIAFVLMRGIGDAFQRRDVPSEFVCDCFLAAGAIFFFQAEDGIRDLTVTGVQTCALPICRGGGVPDAAVQHRGRGPALHGCGHRRRRRPLSRRSRLAARARDRGDGRRRLRGRSRMGPHPRRAAGVLQDERDHHVADAQLRRRVRHDVLDLQHRVVLAADDGLQRERVPDVEDAAECRVVAGGEHLPARRRDRDPRGGAHLVPVHAHALRVRGAGARRLAARRALRRHPNTTQDPRGDGDLRRRRRRRRREPGGRLQPSARRRPERPAEAVLRLHGHRGRGARALQPTRGRRRRLPHRRVAERGQHAARSRLPLRARRRHAGNHPVLRARRRAARPLSRARRTGAAHAGGGVNNSLLVVVLASGVAYGTPLLYASLGEVLAERSGVLNLGVEGMMLVGAVMGFWAVQRVHAATGVSLALAIGVAAIAGIAMAAIHAFLVITLRASQIVSGLALTIFAGAAGLSSYLGNDLNLADNPARHHFDAIFPSSMQHWSIVGTILFGQSLLVYASWICVVAVSLFLSRTRPGLSVRAVGEAPASADAMGINVTRYRYGHTLAGGAFAGVAGATFTLSITPQWTSGITGGAGWIAIALVIFAFWRPALCLVGAYFFGALQALSPQLQAREIHLGPTELWTNSLPYVMTVVVLVFVSASGARRRLGAPASLGLPYVREER